MKHFGRWEVLWEKKKGEEGKGAQECEAGGQEEVMLAQRLEGGEGLSHGDTWAGAFPADGTARFV